MHTAPRTAIYVCTVSLPHEHSTGSACRELCCLVSGRVAEAAVQKPAKAISREQVDVRRGHLSSHMLDLRCHFFLDGAPLASTSMYWTRATKLVAIWNAW